MGTRAAAPGAEPSSILVKAFGLLHSFSTDKRTMSLTEISRASGLPKSTVHRLLERLLDLDAIERHPDGYAVSLRLSNLGAITPAASGRDAAMPYLAWLHRGTGHTVHYAVLRQLEVVYLERLARRDAPPALSGVGARLPANCTAIGKALLAWEDPAEVALLLRRSSLASLTPHSIRDADQLLEEFAAIRRDGLSHERNEAELGLSCVGAPIVVNGFAVAAISMSFPSDGPLDARVEDSIRVAATRMARDFQIALRDGRERWFPFQLD
jgi:DNA-binding IclR family transcriptional regulator